MSRLSRTHAHAHSTACCTCRMTIRSLAIYHPCLALRTFSGMSDVVPVEEVATFLYADGLPVQEVLRLRRRLSSRTITPRLFSLLRQHLLRGGQPVEVTDVIRQRYHASRRGFEDRRRACLRRLSNVGVTVRHLPCFINRPPLVQRVLQFLTPPEFSHVHQVRCACRLWPTQCSFSTTDVELFLDHLEEVHCSS